MKKWPYGDFAYLNLEHLWLSPHKEKPAQKWEYLTVEVVLASASETIALFFDHYAREYKSQRSELNEYLEKLEADGWKLTIAGPRFEGKSYLFRQVKFRRAIQ